MIGLIGRKPQRKEQEDVDDVLVVSGEGRGGESTAAADKADEVAESADEPGREPTTAAATDREVAVDAAPTRRRRIDWRRALVFGLLPVLVILLGGGVAYLQWQKTVLSQTRTARIESVHAATEGTIKILSYNPDTVDRDLDAARDRLTGSFRTAYSQLIHDVVIPGAKEKKISAVATVPGAASLSATPNRAVVVVFVNQTVVIGNDPPSGTSSTVRITVERHDNRWLISDFTPI